MISRKILNLSLYNYKATILNQPQKSLDFWSDFFWGVTSISGLFYIGNTKQTPDFVNMLVIAIFK